MREWTETKLFAEEIPDGLPEGVLLPEDCSFDHAMKVMYCILSGCRTIVNHLLSLF